MKMFYDREIDALYIRLSEDTPVDSVDFAEGISAEVDDVGRIIALEILDLHQHLGEAEQTLMAATKVPTTAA